MLSVWHCNTTHCEIAKHCEMLSTRMGGAIGRCTIYSTIMIEGPLLDHIKTLACNVNSTTKSNCEGWLVCIIIDPSYFSSSSISFFFPLLLINYVDDPISLTFPNLYSDFFSLIVFNFLSLRGTILGLFILRCPVQAQIFSNLLLCECLIENYHQ